MIGRKYSKSLISRLEALEAKAPGTLIFEVVLNDGNTKRIDFSELMAMKEEPCQKDGIYYTGFPEWRIVEGNNLNELDELFYAMFEGGMAVNESI